jgi:hypothetical protein
MVFLCSRPSCADQSMLKVLAAKTDSTIDALMRRGLDHRVNRGAADS